MNENGHPRSLVVKHVLLQDELFLFKHYTPSFSWMKTITIKHQILVRVRGRVDRIQKIALQYSQTSVAGLRATVMCFSK